MLDQRPNSVQPDQTWQNAVSDQGHTVCAHLHSSDSLGFKPGCRWNFTDDCRAAAYGTYFIAPQLSLSRFHHLDMTRVKLSHMPMDVGDAGRKSSNHHSCHYFSQCEWLRESFNNFHSILTCMH